MQPRERGGTKRGERGSRGARRPEQQGQRAARRERRRRLRVEVERVEEERRPGRREPRHQGSALVPGELERQAPADERRRRGQQGHDQHAALPPQGRVGGREEQGQARAVGRKGPPVGPRRAPVRPERAGHELGPLLPVVLVAQVQVVIAPEALGHHEIVRLVARDLEPGGVPQARRRRRASRPRPAAATSAPAREPAHPGRRLSRTRTRARSAATATSTSAAGPRRSPRLGRRSTSGEIRATPIGSTRPSASSSAQRRQPDDCMRPRSLSEKAQRPRAGHRSIPRRY